MGLDGEEKEYDDVRSHKRRHRFEVQSKGWLVEELQTWLKDQHKKIKIKIYTNPEEQAYSSEVTTPVLKAFSKGSEGEESHACRELNPTAIYL